MHVYVETVKPPHMRWEVMSYDKATSTARLRGQHGTEFSRVVSKDALQKYGYKLVQSEKELPLVEPPSPKTVGTIPDKDDPAVVLDKKKKAK